MFQPRSFHYFTAIAVSLILSACNAPFSKTTSFNKAISFQAAHSPVKSTPYQSPSPSPTVSPAPLAAASPDVVTVPPTPIQSLSPVQAPKPKESAEPQPIVQPVVKPITPPTSMPSAPLTGDLTGNYVSLDSDLEIASSKNFVLHTQAWAALNTNPNSQTLCKIDREGTIDSVVTDGAAPAVHFNIASEKFSSVQADGASDNFCAEVGKSLSQAHSLSAPLLASGNGFLLLKLDETSSDGISITTSQDVLSGLFFDSDQATDLSSALLPLLSGQYSGAFGGFVINPPIPRLTLSIDQKPGRFDLIDNECAFSVSGPIAATGKSGSIILSSESNSLSTTTLTTTAAKGYAVYYGRLSGGCAQRKQSFVSQLTGAGIKLETTTQDGKYALDFSAVGGSGFKYTIRAN